MEKYMELALLEAKKAYKKGDVPIGCVIVKDNKIIAKSHNTREKTNIVTNHAEIIAINKACKRLKNWRLIGCTIYVTKQPCDMCLSAIKQARMECLVYGTENDEKVVNYKTKIINNVLKTECDDILKNFFIERRKDKN